MAKYSVEDSTMTAIGDPIRTLMGLTEQLSPSAMATNLNGANAEVGTQTDLIAQILEAATGKAVSNVESMATGTLTLNSSQSVATKGGTITHNLGWIPSHMLWFIIDTTSKNTSNMVNGAYKSAFEYIAQNKYITAASSSGSISSANDMYFKVSEAPVFAAFNANEETATLFYAQEHRSSTQIPAGSTIFWMVW
jgi:hypothetical protein